MVDVGLTVYGLLLEPPFHKYVDPPEAVNAELCPLQTADGDAVAVIVAVEFTVTVTVAVPVQPVADVPVTVYVVVDDGVTLIEEPLPPVLHE